MQLRCLNVWWFLALSFQIKLSDELRKDLDMNDFDYIDMEVELEVEFGTIYIHQLFVESKTNFLKIRLLWMLVLFHS